MTMTPKALYSAARMAVRLARECERSALDYDTAWHDRMHTESKRHRKRAAGYLQSRKWLLAQPQQPFERAA